MQRPTALAQFGASVVDVRVRKGYSQEELAERAGLHRTYIAGVEAGTRNITLKSMAKLAQALEVSISALLSPSLRKSSVPKEIHIGKVVDILLIEDNPDDEALTVAAFKDAGIANRLIVLPDGDQALNYLFSKGLFAGPLSQPAPHLILLDLNLPTISGLEVLRRIKRNRRTRSIPVVVLTASKNSRDIAASRSLGAANYIVKPVDFQNFSRVTPELSLKWTLAEPIFNDP